MRPRLEPIASSPPPRRLPGPALPGFTALLVTVASILALELLADAVLLPPAVMVLLVVVAGAAYASGLVPALAGAALSTAYIYYRAVIGQPAQGWFATPAGEAVLIGLTMITAAVLIGALRTRLNDVLERERKLRGIAVEGEQRLIAVLENMAEGFITIEADWRAAYVNPHGARLLGREPGELLGRNMWDVYPEAGEAGTFDELRRGMAERKAVEFEAEYRPAGRVFEVRAYPAGEGLSIYFRDVTEQAHARRFAALSQRLLADTGVTLAASLDVDRTLDAFARLIVPALGDCCAITVSDESGGARLLPPVLPAHASPDVAAAVARLFASGVAPEVMASLAEDEALTADTDGEATAPRDGEAAAQHDAGSGTLRALVREAGFNAALVAPLSAHGRTLGTITLLATTRGRYGRAELELVEELARRAAIALDNIRLYDTALLANRAKSDFLAIMSHELRTPLTTVMGYTDLLLSGVPEPLPTVAVRYVERVRMAAWHLLAIIEQILVYTRLDVGTEELQHVRVSVADTLHDAAALIEPVARDRGVAFAVMPPTEPIEMITDQTKLRQILLNLLSNAVRFTDEGGVSIEASRVDECARFIVRDTGIGIAPENLERVFEPFWQVDAADTRRTGGTGLGLSVARRLARLLGGDVTAASEPGVGTAFTVTVPIQPPVPRRGAG